MKRDLDNQPAATRRSRAVLHRRLAQRRCTAALGCAAAAALFVGCNRPDPAPKTAAQPAAAPKAVPATTAAANSDRDAALTQAIEVAMKRASIPGAIVGVWREGQPPYVRAFGVRDLATGVAMAIDLFMRIGSATKPIVATCILMLADRGKLDLDDPIERYVKGL